MTAQPSLIHFPGALGTSLAARLDLPIGQPRAYALFAHCFTCSKESLAATRIGATLTARGFGVLRFDFTGLGGSEGDFANTNFSSNVADLVAAANWLRAEHQAPAILIGHSLGGAAVLAAAHEIAEAAAVATIGAPYDPAHVQHLFADAAPAIHAQGEAEVNLAGRRFNIRKQFLDDLNLQQSQQRIGALRKALLVLHSPRDTIVNIDNAAQIFMAAKHPKSFVSLDTADHLLTGKADAVYVADVLAAWASRYVQAEDAAAAPQGVVTVTETREGRFTQSVRAGAHHLRADEPASVGGDDSGFTPYDLLLAGLGACTSMTMRLYADQKKWPLERVSVQLRHHKIHAQDCAECETREGKVDRIERDIEISGELDDAQRARLMEIADKCPVHRTLHAEASIVTRAATP